MQPVSSRRRLWTFSAIALLVSGAVGLQLQRAARDRAARAEVHHWIGTMDWWDKSKTEAENERRKLEGLRSLGGAAVEVLRKDLHYNPALMRLLQRFPALQRFLGGLGPADEPNEIRHRAIYHLGRLGQPAQSAIPDVANLGSDPDERIRSEVAFTLGLLRGDSPVARKSLEAMRKDPEPRVRFSAAIALWNLARTNSTLMGQVSALITTNNLSWPSICLMHLGSEAAVFAPHLRQVLLQSKWSMPRAQAVHAVWSMEGDPDFVITQINTLETQVLQNPGQTNNDSGWTEGESNWANMTQYFIDDRRFRDRLRPMLHHILDDPGSRAHRFASVYLQKFDQLDRRATVPSSDNTHDEASRPSPPP